MSGNYLVRPGMALRHEGVRIVFKKRAKDPGGSYLFEDERGFQFSFTGEDLSKLRSKGDLPDWVPDPKLAEGAQAPSARITWDNADATEKAETMRSIDYCMAWAAAPGTPRSATGLPPLIQRVHARRKLEADAAGRFEPPPPSWSWMNKWLRDWLARGQVADALVPQTRNRGNHRTKLSLPMSLLLRDWIDEFYLTGKRWPISKVHAEFVKELARRDAGLPLESRRKAPSYEAARHVVNGLCQFTVDYCRKGARYALEKWRAVGSGLITERPNQYWEIDDTRVDLICVAEDRKLVIGRPWLIVVIDRHTRMLMSFGLSFSPPDTTTALDAIKMAILRKDELLEAEGIGGTYEAHGKPDEIHVDNAKHYNSEALTQALTRLGIRHKTMPVLKAWYKGTVERVIGTVSRQVFHVVPGTTYSGIYERDDETPPETVAEATIAEVRTRLLEWIVKEYQLRHHRGIDAAPLSLWRESMKDRKNHAFFPLDRNDVESALTLTMGTRATRKVGITFRYLIYGSEDFTRLRPRSKNQKVEEVLIRINRQNLESIEFLDPESGEWLKAFLKHDLVPRVRGRTLEEYDLARAMRRNRPPEFADGDPDFVQTYELIEESRREAEGSKRQADRVRAAAAKERNFKHASKLTRPERDAAPQEGTDLASLIAMDDDTVAGAAAVPVRVPLPPPPAGATSPEPVDRAPETEGDEYDLDSYAAELGLGSSVRRPGGEG